MRAALASVAVLASVSAVGQSPSTSSSTDFEVTIAAGNCLLEVRGKRYLSGPCEIEITRDSVLVRPDGRRAHFAVVAIEHDRVMGFWNGEEALGTAHVKLGDMAREGSCWANQISRICAWPRRVKRRVTF
jgi:hypothetical protein